VAAFNTGAVPIAVNAGGFVPTATLAAGNQKSTYRLKILAASSTLAKTPADLPKPSEKIADYLVLTDATSNSGYKAPLSLLAAQGIRPGLDFAWRYSGGHRQSIEGLASGEYRYVAVASDILERELKASKIQASQFRIIFESEPFPTATFGVAHNLKPELAAKLRAALLDFKFDGNSVGQYFAASDQTGLTPVDFKVDFDLVRKIDDQIGFAHVLIVPSTEPAEPAVVDPASTQPAVEEPLPPGRRE
jgi:phosphonate transport system substrate-binding protein